MDDPSVSSSHPATAAGNGVPARHATLDRIASHGIGASSPQHEAGDPLLAPEPIIRFVRVNKSFGKQRVLENLDLDIPTAKTTVVLGPSGCGKSVMLKHIIGLLRPDSGEVYYAGTRVDTLSEKQLRTIRLEIGLLFQMGALFDSMTVQENIEFPLLEHTSLTPRQRLEKIAIALETVDLAGMQKKLPSQLSGGQKKRVALARAIVLQPRVILFDEPTTGLDPIRADGINELVIKLNRTLGVTNLVVTHDLVSARKIADHVVMLLAGKVAARGTFADLEAHPDPRVQHFLAGKYDHDEDSPETLAKLKSSTPIGELVR